MSVLNFPRIYFNGHMFWNPPTANNNDVLPVYEAVKMEMNWPFLATYGINPQNADKTLMPWMINPLDMSTLPDYVLQVPTNAPKPDGKIHRIIPAEWDLFGDNGCGTVNYSNTHSVIIGGELPGGNYIGSDALINKPYQLLGNPLGSNSLPPARFVDISPWQNTFTALYFDKLVLGDNQCGLTLNREHRMLDRFLNFSWAPLGGLMTVTTTWQTCFPKDHLHWVMGGSQLLHNLYDQMQRQGAKGLMFRFSTYLTCYDKNGIFNNYPPIDTHSSDLAAQENVRAMYEKGLNNVADIFFNPAYSRTNGVLGLWFDGEFPTAPSGRRLTPAAPISVYKEKEGDTTLDDGVEIRLGVTSTYLQPDRDVISLDLLNTFPFYQANDEGAPIPIPEKFHSGDFTLGVNHDNQFTAVANFGFNQYKQAAFDKRSGILDLPFDPSLRQKLQAGTLELRLQGTTTATATQQKWTAEVVQSGGFIDVGDHSDLQIMVQCDGKPAPAGTLLWVAEYNNPYMLTTSNYYLAFSNDANFNLYCNFPSHPNLNKPGMPQFIGAPTLNRTADVGSGRRLKAVGLESDEKCQNPVTYQQYRHTPASVSLAPCLALENASPMEGVLNDELKNTVQYSLAAIKTNAQGIATLRIKAIAPGFPTLRFFIQDGTQAPPVPFSFKYTTAYTDFLAPLRVLPLEPKLQQDFINEWNKVYKNADAGQQIWASFIYPRILQPFYYLYPIMSKYMPLNSLSRIEGAIDQLIVLVSKPYQEESTLAMPITRDLPQSRRAVLELWAQSLVKRNYPPTPLSMSDFNNR